ncbi:hypothetical protein Ahy_A09g043113 [Arachis hypogaea]|uniref:Protein FAR1-RELATED SEQUENCE n=1 Tax=Arachis hypogaea TaxID=3818 RepID=A0A445BHJ2_ARAHY|nr:hypothetical protein Ahy_A09g043113 [Arachis hypogaea]
MKNRKREPKSETRCACLARFVARFVAYTGRWHVALYVKSHNHDCLDTRKIAEANVSQMSNMKDAGISTPYICTMLANQEGGYENVNYTLRDIYNEIARRRRHVLVLKIVLKPLEKIASNFYTREIFFIIRPMLVRAVKMMVVQDVAFDLNSSWEVFVDNKMMKFNFSCLRMDSFRIPCEHIVCVLVFLNIIELLKSLVLTWWSKNAKTSTFDSSGVTWVSIILSQYGCLMDWCWQLSYVFSRRKERFHLIRDTIMSLIEDFKIEDEQEKHVSAEADGSDGIFSKNPQNCRSKCRPGEKINASCATSHGINRNPFEEGLDAYAEMIDQYFVCRDFGHLIFKKIMTNKILDRRF